MKIFLIYCGTIILLHFSFLPVYGQSIPADVSKSGTTAGTFLEIPVGPTAIQGMGSAFVKDIAKYRYGALLESGRYCRNATVQFYRRSYKLDCRYTI